MLECLLIGSIAYDNIINLVSKTETTSPGGPGYFIAKALASMNVKCDLLAKVGSDFKINDFPDLNNKNINLRLIKTKNKTTRVAIEVDEHGEYGSLREYVGDLEVSDLPKKLNYNFCIISTVVPEVSNKIISKLNMPVFLDIQGFIRTKTFYNPPKVRKWERVFLKDISILSSITTLKASDYEIDFIAKGDTLENKLKYLHSLGPKICIITQGSKGAYFSNRDKIIKLSAIKIKKLVHTIGAGDTLLSCFSKMYSKTSDLEYSAKYSMAYTHLFLKGRDTSKENIEEIVKKHY